MACESCQRYQQRQIEKRREIQQRKRERLAESCARGDKRSCILLDQMDSLADYRQQNRYRPEMHRRAGYAMKNPAIADGVNICR